VAIAGGIVADWAHCLETAPMTSGSRISFVPRSVWPILVLLVAAVLWLTFNGENDEGRVLLVETDVERIEYFQVTRGRNVTELHRSASGWVLQGSTVDYLDDGSVQDMLTGLTTAYRSGASLNPDAADSYGLTEALVTDVAVTTDDGQTWSLRFGTTNTVTDIAYVQDMEQGTIHLVDAPILARLQRLPDSIRAKSFWPHDTPVTDQRVVTIDRNGQHLRFERDRLERWWWRMDSALTGDSSLPVFLYQQHYTDRQRASDGSTLWRADDRRLRNVLAAVERAPVARFHRASQSVLGADGTTSAIMLTIGDEDLAVDYVLGAITEDDRLQAWRGADRRGFDTHADVREFTDVDLVDWLHSDALTVRLVAVDSFSLSMPTVGAITAYQAGERSWTTVEPGSKPDPILGDLAHAIDRLVMLQVLLPQPDPTLVFNSMPRLTITTWQQGSGMPKLQSLDIGISVDGNAMMAWRESDGFVAEISNGIFVSGRNYLTGRKQ
jgi:hypothetical protein